MNFTSSNPGAGQYVAGLGRGAIGFTTRSDIGPARSEDEGEGVTRERVDFGRAPEGYVAGMGRGMGQIAKAQGETSLEREVLAKESAALNESNFDEFHGYSSSNGLLSQGIQFDADDLEADRVYEAVDERMDSRRKRAREAKLIEQVKKLRAERPKISDQFADLKRELKEVSHEEWEGIPEVGGDHSLRYKQKKVERFTPMTDSMLASLKTKSEHVSTLQNSIDGQETSIQSTTGLFRVGDEAQGSNGSISNTTTELGAARGTVLGLKLDRMSDSVSGQTVVDPQGYLTGLNSVKVNSASEIGDIKKARLLLKSVTSTNPKHGPGWIAAARVEDVAGRLGAARKIIGQGCEACPENEDVWLEASAMEPSLIGKQNVLSRAVGRLPRSTKLWLEAARLENDLEKKKHVLRRALELIPRSVALWRAAIDLEGVEDARILLGRAVECVPHAVDIWLALARLETYENARKVLNQARQALPSEPQIWVTAAKLEEAHGHGADVVDSIVAKALVSLGQYQVVIDREKWLAEARSAEDADSPLTCAAIIRHTIGLGVEEEDKRRTWLDDADASLAQGSIATARAILSHTLHEFPTKKHVWLRAAELERKHGTPEALLAILKAAVDHCPRTEILWLMRAKEQWLSRDLDGARETLADAFAANPNSEEVWLAAVKLEWENNQPERARSLLAKAREKAASPRVYMKSALLERHLQDPNTEIQLLDEAIEKYPDFDKLYIMAGQNKLRRFQEAAHTTENSVSILKPARDYFQRGLRHCPRSIPLWILASQLEEQHSTLPKARTVLELARLKNAKNPELWLASIRLERRAGNLKLAENLAAKALQECPTSGLLWADQIDSAPAPARKNRSLEALKRCEDDVHVVLAVANLFAADKKPKARKWYNRAVGLDPDLGDAWAALYAFELEQGDTDSQADVRQRAIDAEPSHGELWTSVSKHPDNAGKSIAAVLSLAATKFTALMVSRHDFAENKSIRGSGS